MKPASEFSENQLDPNDPHSPFRRGREESSYTRLWIILSLAFSSCVLAWVISVPFRSASVATVDSTEESIGSSAEIDLAEQLERDRTRAEQFRAQALEMDRQLMIAVAEASYQPPKPGIDHARQYRKNYRRRLAQQIKDLGQPEENSLEWHHQQDLKAKLASRDDGPLEEFDE